MNTALERGHEVTAFARGPEKLGLSNPRLQTVAGSFHDPAQIDAAVKGHDAVIITASSTTLSGFRENPRYFSMGTANVIASMKKHGVRRLSVLSALGTGESAVLMPWPLRKLVLGWILKLPFEDHERQEQMVRESDLQWVIARPGRLTAGPARRAYQKKANMEPVPSSISRADVADFLVEACESDVWLGRAVQIGG